jgi:hypothetical protein
MIGVQFISHRPRVERQIEAVARAAMETGGTKYVSLLVRNLKGQRHGITYPLPGRAKGSKKTYVASAPYEYPAVRLGLISGPGGYRHDVWSNALFWGVTIGSRFEHARYLEERPISRGGRPHMKRTYDENREEILGAFVRGFRVAAAKSGGRI